MTIPDDLVIDVRGQEIILISDGKTVRISNDGRHGVFANGPVRWSDLMFRYIAPALAQFK